MFVNRVNEKNRLIHALAQPRTQLIVLYGRRRCGKSTLLREVMTGDSVFFTADLREPPLQIAALSKSVGALIPGFDRVFYPDWESLFLAMNRSLHTWITLCLDEFPYLVKNSPGLPSVLQKLMDERDTLLFHLVLCGSSQQMMEGVAINSNAPLYGRADEIMRIGPMSPADLASFLQLPSSQAIEEFGVWGGVPRYWEIRLKERSLEKAVIYHVLDPLGILHDEPERLFADELRTSVQAFSVISLIAGGCNRLSEIAGRLNKPATQLSRILSFLTGLGYIRREIPFGETARSTKKSLYKINDPFLNFYFSFVVPNTSLLGAGLTGTVWNEVRSRSGIYVSQIWEEECRKKIPLIEIGGKRFNNASRWWGAGLDGKQMEIDLVALSQDRTSLLVGEAKWTEQADATEAERQLCKKIGVLPFVRDKKIVKALFLKSKPRNHSGETILFDADDICS
jgi:AAA+ ATPase superfamily predicted ATPase